MKNTLNLTRLETPVYYGLLITGHLDVSEDLENHYNAIDNVGGLGELVVLGAMKDAVQLLIGRRSFRTTVHQRT